MVPSKDEKTEMRSPREAGIRGRKGIIEEKV